MSRRVKRTRDDPEKTCSTRSGTTSFVPPIRPHLLRRAIRGTSVLTPSFFWHFQSMRRAVSIALYPKGLLRAAWSTVYTPVSFLHKVHVSSSFLGPAVFQYSGKLSALHPAWSRLLPVPSTRIAASACSSSPVGLLVPMGMSRVTSEEHVVRPQCGGNHSGSQLYIFVLTVLYRTRTIVSERDPRLDSITSADRTSSFSLLRTCVVPPSAASIPESLLGSPRPSRSPVFSFNRVYGGE